MSDELPTLDVRPTDRERIPPGQSQTRKWPVLHYGGVPHVNPDTWRFEFRGLCAAPNSYTLKEIQDFPRQITRCELSAAKMRPSSATATPVRAEVEPSRLPIISISPSVVTRAT